MPHFTTRTTIAAVIAARQELQRAKVFNSNKRRSSFDLRGFTSDLRSPLVAVSYIADNTNLPSGCGGLSNCNFTLKPVGKEVELFETFHATKPSRNSPWSAEMYPNRVKRGLRSETYKTCCFTLSERLFHSQSRVSSQRGVPIRNHGLHHCCAHSSLDRKSSSNTAQLKPTTPRKRSTMPKFVVHEILHNRKYQA